MGESYEREGRALDFRVTTALHKTSADISRVLGISPRQPMHGIRPVSTGIYVLPVDTFLERDILSQLLATSLYEENIPPDFRYSLFRGDKTVYSGQSGDRSPQHPVRVPQLSERAGYSVVVSFPAAEGMLISGMKVWGIVTLCIIAAIGILGYGLYLAFEQRRLQEIQKDFVMNMTHEFKTPLSSIRLAADVLKNPSILQSPQRLTNYATIIADEAAQLTAQVDRVLQVTRVEQGAIEMEQEPVVWQHLLENASRKYRQMVEDKAGQLYLHLPEKPIFFTGDAQHLQAAVGNLVDNALKYCTDCPEIHIFLKNFRKNIRVTVQDNGIGIGKQHQKMLFKKFYRVPTGNIHNVRGYGLGLNYVRIIAGAHGGTVECESTPGSGASFTMVFPG